ncbi:MAG TPA: hypothetical protein VMQ81_06880 [Acidimicrobiia bacterium]|nr:hypothetical protein [Acidimicrobiia bacterium]
MNPRRDAYERLGGAYDPRVLEPSPPVVTEGPWFADDPVSPEDRPLGRLPVVTPVTGGDTTWDELCRDDPDLSRWCTERWLGAWQPLPPLPARDRLPATRCAWHALAEHVLSPARHAANGKIGLRFTRSGFGTPFFPGAAGDEQVRVEGTSLVVDLGETIRRAPITTVAAAAEFARCAAGAPSGARYEEGGVTGVFEPTTPFTPDAPLELDPGATQALGEWFGFAASVLEQLRAEAEPADAAARVQLWPEHFDLSVDAGHEEAGARGTFGLSPGDGDHDEPYVYVTHWTDVPPDPFWNDAAFGGASLPFGDVVAADDQRAAALEFLRTGRRLLRGH